MKNIKIFFYNNHTNLKIPKKINTFPVDVVFGDTMSEIKSHIGRCQLYCVFTHIAEANIIVPTEQDKEIIQNILSFTKRKENVIVEDSIWYSDKAPRNIIISDTCNFLPADIDAILSMYLRKVDLIEKRSIKEIEMYIVYNTRNGEVLIKTPNKNEAVDVCDRNPCCVIKTRDDEVVYTSRYGKTSLTSSIRRMKARQADSNGVFHIKIKG